MTCETFQKFLPDLLLDPAHAPAEAMQHLDSCFICQKEMQSLHGTMQLLDAWEAPEPSPYFDVRMAARLREEKNAPAAGWLERLRDRLLFQQHTALRPALAAALALLLIVGAGSYEGFVSLNHTQPSVTAQNVSPTVKDLELLDSNAQTLQEMASFDEDASMGQAQPAQNGSTN